MTGKMKLNVKKNVSDSKRVVRTKITPTAGIMNEKHLLEIGNKIIKPAIKKNTDDGWAVSSYVRLLTSTGWISSDEYDKYFEGKAVDNGHEPKYHALEITIISER